MKRVIVFLMIKETREVSETLDNNFSHAYSPEKVSVDC